MENKDVSLDVNEIIEDFCRNHPAYTKISEGKGLIQHLKDRLEIGEKVGKPCMKMTYTIKGEPLCVIIAKRSAGDLFIRSDDAFFMSKDYVEILKNPKKELNGKDHFIIFDKYFAP